VVMELTIHFISNTFGDRHGSNPTRLSASDHLTLGMG